MNHIENGALTFVECLAQLEENTLVVVAFKVGPPVEGIITFLGSDFMKIKLSGKKRLVLVRFNDVSTIGYPDNS